jgi:hypothetical protein
MPFGLFANKRVPEFAAKLTDKLAKRYPPAIDMNPDKKVSQARLTRVLEETLQQAADFQREHNLGMFGKAKLGNEFKWRLKELGYSEKFIEVATEGLMVYITRGSSPAASVPTEKKA